MWRAAPPAVRAPDVTAGVTDGTTTGAPDASTLALERRGDALVFTWAVPAETRAPALQLLLVRRGAEDIETETRTIALDAVRGTTTIDVPGLHSVRAAVGWLDDARFVPLARLPPSSP